MKKVISVLVVFMLLFNVGALASTNKPLKNLSKGLDDVFYGKIEIPDNMNETNSKGKVPYPDCTDDTKKGVGRGIVRIIGGLWEIATFWYPEE